MTFACWSPILLLCLQSSVTATHGVNSYLGHPRNDPWHVAYMKQGFLDDRVGILLLMYVQGNSPQYRCRSLIADAVKMPFPIVEHRRNMLWHVVVTQFFQNSSTHGHSSGIWTRMCLADRLLNPGLLVVHGRYLSLRDLHYYPLALHASLILKPYLVEGICRWRRHNI